MITVQFCLFNCWVELFDYHTGRFRYIFRLRFWQCTHGLWAGYYYAVLGEHMNNGNLCTRFVLNPRTAKLFQLTFTAKGGLLQPPLDVGLRPNFFVKFFMGIVSGLRNPKVIVRIFYLYHVTLKHKVIDLERNRVYCPWPSLSRSRSGSTAFIYRFSNSLTQKT